MYILENSLLYRFTMTTNMNSTLKFVQFFYIDNCALFFNFIYRFSSNKDEIKKDVESVVHFKRFF